MLLGELPRREASIRQAVPPRIGLDDRRDLRQLFAGHLREEVVLDVITIRGLVNYEARGVNYRSEVFIT